MPPVDPSLNSPYAPPRAGRGSGLWRAWFAFRRKSKIGEIPLSPAFIALRGMVVTSSTLSAVCIPTLGFYLVPNPLWRRIGPAIFWFTLFFALTEYARPLGAAAFGIAAAAHGIAAATCADAHEPLLRYSRRILRRLLIALAAILVLTLVAHLITSPFLIAVAGKDGPVLIAPSSTPPARVGELVAYRLSGRDNGGFRVHGGVYWGRVLAVPPSQTVAFDGDHYFVDGSPHPALPRMPAQNQIQIDRDHMFIWPEIVRFQQGSTARFPADIGLVPQSALVGRPYKRWFWHKQNP